MRDLTESNVTDAVLNVIADDTNPRLKEIMEALIRHSHDFIREVNLSPDELLYAARFIQNVGHISDDKREEGVLLGDVLGMTALVEILGVGFHWTKKEALHTSQLVMLEDILME